MASRTLTSSDRESIREIIQGIMYKTHSDYNDGYVSKCDDCKLLRKNLNAWLEKHSK